jgi:rod shape-determining protein MreD
MNLALLVFALVVGAAVQSLLPTIAWAGGAPVPVLAALSLGYALRAPEGFALAAALVAGLVQDGVSLMPLGYSSFGFAVVTLILLGQRDIMVVDSWFTHLVLGVAAGLAVQAMIAGFLTLSGRASFAPGFMVARMLGGGLLLGLLTPLVIPLLRQMEVVLGLAGDGEDSV